MFLFFVPQEDMSSYGTVRRVFLWHKKTCLLVAQEDMSACGTRRDVFLGRKKTSLLVSQGEMSSCETRRYVLLLNKRNDWSQSQEWGGIWQDVLILPIFLPALCNFCAAGSTPLCVKQDALYGYILFI